MTSDITARALELAAEFRQHGEPQAAHSVEACFRSWDDTSQSLVDLYETFRVLQGSHRDSLSADGKKKMAALLRDIKASLKLR